MQTLFVTGTDTGVGKTWISCLILRQFQAHGIDVGVYKPVCSGARGDHDSGWHWDDVDLLRRACGTDLSDDLVCPQRFLAAVAPNVAAHQENLTVNDRLLSAGVSAWKDRVDWLVVEGAGGVYCPLSDARTVLDLILELQGPVIVVAANRLGVISHTRMTVESLRSRGVMVAAIVLNDIAPPVRPTQEYSFDESSLSNAAQLQYWIPDVPLCHCAWNSRTLTALVPPGHGDLQKKLWAILTQAPAMP